jgi:cobyrinic acid a,c-diamide synthase
VPFDPLRSHGLPDRTKAVILGGGFPEEHAEQLSANRALLSDLWSFEGPIVAECGGLIYLGQRLDGVPMVGRLPIMSKMTDDLVLGYREARAPSDSVLAERGATVHGHEFHRTRTDPVHGDVPAWEVADGMQGFAQGWVHASYVHLNWAGYPWIASRLVEATLARP